MKKALFLVMFYSFSSMANMTGHWKSVSRSKSFVLDIEQSGEHLSGKYCFITNNGNCIDCAEKDDEDNIIGAIKHSVVEIKFENTFGGMGKTTAIVNGNKLNDTIKDKAPFIQVNISIPDEIELIKTK